MMWPNEFGLLCIEWFGLTFGTDLATMVGLVGMLLWFVPFIAIPVIVGGIFLPKTKTR